MDDLTQIHGIGAATAKKLVAAGIDSFAKLAAATPDQLNAAKVAGGPDDWSAFIAAAAKLAAGPADRQLTAEEVATLVTAWDDARAELSAAGEAVAALQSQIDSIEPGSDLAQLDTDLEIARQRVATAHAVIDALRPLPEGVRLPDAKPKPEIPADAQIDGQAQQETPAVPAQPGQGSGEGTAKDAPLEPGAVARASDTHTTSEADLLDGEAGNLAGLTQADIDRMVALEVARVGDSVRAAAELDLEAALAHLAEERRRAHLMISMAGLISAELSAIELELTRTETVWPLTVIRMDGFDQPIGVALKVDPKTFETLTSSGAASDRAPEAD